MDSDLGDNQPSATFNFVLKNFTNCVRESGVYSLPCKIRNIPWKLRVSKHSDSGEKNLGISVSCAAEDDLNLVCHRHWNCSAKVKVSLLHQSSSIKHFIREFDLVFHSGVGGWGWNSFISWDTVTNPESGYIKDNTVYIRAEIIVSNPVGIKYNVKDDDNKAELLESKRKIQSLESEVARLKGDLKVEKCQMLHLQKDLADEKSELQQLKNNVANEKAELQVLKNDLANEKAELELLKKNAASAETEFQVLKNDSANEKAELQRLKNDIANEKIDTQSKLKILETLLTNSVLQISELKKAKESPAQNTSPSTNSSTEDLRSEVRDVLLSLLSSK